MNLSSLSIKYPLPAILLFIVLSALGILSFRNMSVQSFPDIEFPMVTVTTSLPGASPVQLETEVARRIENAVATVADVHHIRSTISDGSVSTNIQFRLEKDVSDALDEVRDAINRVRGDMPPEVREPIYGKMQTSGTPFLTYTVGSDQLDEEALSWFVDNEVSKALLKVPGVGRIGRVGGVSRAVLIELDPVRLLALNASAADISRQVQRILQEAPSGVADLGGARLALRTIGRAGSVADIAALEISLPSGQRVRLDQVAHVSDGIEERAAMTLLDGKPVVGFNITRSKGASEITVAKAVQKVVVALNAKNPKVQAKIAVDNSVAVQDDFDGSMLLLYEGALLAILVVWIFLRDWRATLISAAALPLSVLPTFLVIHLLGFSLNTVTLLSLALVIGILVDDAIVEIENIVRHLKMGKTPYQAAMEAADEIGLAVVATTFTLIAVFLPTAFMSGVVGKYFKQFGWTAAVAVAASLLVARMLTPMMAAYLLRPIVQQEEQHSWVMRKYLRAAAWCLRRRKTTSALAVLFFIASLALIPLLPTGFIPAGDPAQTAISIELPPGSTLAQTRASAELARELAKRDPDVLTVYSEIGGADVRKANLKLLLTPRNLRARKQTEIDTALRERLTVLPGARITVGTGDSGEALTLILLGDNSDELARVAQTVLREIRTIPKIGNVTSTSSEVRPEIIITPDVVQAANFGVTTAAIGETLRVATAGDYDQSLAKLNLPGRQIPIRIRLPEAAREDLAFLQRLPVPGKSGNVPLGAVATLRLDSGPASIERLDRSRQVTVTVELNGQPFSAILAQVDILPSLVNLPASVKRGASGQAEAMEDLFTGFGLAMLTGIVCVYMVLVLLFRSLVHPVTILAALPLSIGGAFVALLVTRSAFSMPSLIGLLMLMGIAVKNSILLVEYVIVARRKLGMTRVEALMDACHKRAQPIVMTTIAMGAGMLPIAMGLGADPSFRSPMAIAVIGGLITSTFLSLLVIPVVFTYVDDLLEWCKLRLRRSHAANTQAHTIAAEVVP